MDDVTAFKTLEPVVDHAIRVVGSGIEIFGVLIIVTGIAWSTFRQLLQRISDQDSEVYKIRIGRSLLLGLEVLVAADIVKTMAHELTSMSLILLAGLVLVRTFLSWTLVLEIEGRWPWQREPSPMSSRRQYSRSIAVTYRLESHSAFPFDMVSVNCQCRCSPSGEAQQRRSLTCPIASRAVEASFWRVSPRDPYSSGYHRRSPAAAPATR